MSISKNLHALEDNSKRHSFIMPKKILFINNKGGVGKTTIAFNTACKLAQKGYKTCIVDLDPECNTTMSIVGNEEDNGDLFRQSYASQNPKTIYEIIKLQIEGTGDVIYDEKPKMIQDNLFLIAGDLSMSLFEESASNAYTQAASGQILGFRIITAVERYINSIGRDMEIDFFIMDTSPSLGMMNRLFLLGADHFVVPVLSDAYSFQGVENLGTVLSRWKEEWKLIKQSVVKARAIPSDLVFDGDPRCLGYISNKLKPYAKAQTKAQKYWAEKIEESSQKNLTIHSNKISNLSIKIIDLADYGTLMNESQKNNKAIFDLTTQDTTQINLGGSKELLLKSSEEFEELANSIINRLELNF